MKDKIICKKVTSMLSLYIDKNLSTNEMFFVKEHIAICPTCRKKYLYLKSLIKSLQDSYSQLIERSKQKEKQKIFSIKEYEKFLNLISPYIDNELDINECFEFRKYLMKSQNIQKELKSLYTIQKNLKYIFIQTKKAAPKEITKTVTKKLRKTPCFFDSVILPDFLNNKVAKIAILSGMLIIGTYEIKLMDKPLLQTKIKQTLKQIIDKEQYNTNIDDFDNYKNSIGSTNQ